MEWLQIETTLPDHRKVIRLASELKISRMEAVGIVVSFWLWAIHNREDGVLEPFDTDTIARVVDFKGKPVRLISALHRCGFLDDAPNGYVIHDWDERAGMLIDKREKMREQSRNRVRNYRERKKKSVTMDIEGCNADCSGDVMRYCNDDVTHYNSVTVTQDSNDSNALGNADVTHPQNSTVHKYIDDDDLRAGAGARAREELDDTTEQDTKRIKLAFETWIGREPTPAELDGIRDDCYLRFNEPGVAIAAIQIAGANGAKNPLPYIKMLYADWERYPVKSEKQALALHSLMTTARMKGLGSFGNDFNAIAAGKKLDAFQRGEIEI